MEDMRSTLTRRGLAALTLTAVLVTAAPWNGNAHALKPVLATGIARGSGTGDHNDGPAGTGAGTAPGEGRDETTETSPAAPATWKNVVVDLSEQSLTVYDRRGTIVFTRPISSGSTKTPTPTGRYRVTSKSRRTFAVTNPDVTMEHMVRFNGGIGFHSIPRRGGIPLATPLGERGVSHGCIRMADQDARTLYRNLPVGASVIVQL